MDPLFTTEAGDGLSRAAPPVVESPALRRVYETARRAADSSLNVLILGERGVGKTSLARWIHTQSRRSGCALVSLPCAASEYSIEAAMFGYARGTFVNASSGQPGAFESAGGGTVVLENLESLGLAPQTKLLYAVENRETTRMGTGRSVRIEARVISTASTELEAAVRDRAFRMDLFHRLNTITLRIPPLRECREEIEPLARHFLSEAAPPGPPRLTFEVLELFRSFTWPGNLTQLRDVVGKAHARCTGPEITPEHIDVDTLRAERAPEPRKDAKPETPPDLTEEERAERTRIIAALSDVRTNATRAAARLGLSRRTLIAKIERYRIPRPSLHDPAK
jgi:DNA-binding NtrC family response regulator